MLCMKHDGGAVNLKTLRVVFTDNFGAESESWSRIESLAESSDILLVATDELDRYLE